MTEEQEEQQLKDKLERLGYPAYLIKLGIGDVPMLYISQRLICGVGHALERSDESLAGLIAETLTYWEALMPKPSELESVAQPESKDVAQEEGEPQNADTGQN